MSSTYHLFPGHAKVLADSAEILISKANIAGSEKKNKMEDIKAIRELADIIPNIKSYAANRFIKLGDKYFTTNQIQENFVSENKMNQKDAYDYVDKFIQENKVYKLVDGKYVELTPKELKIFKENFTQLVRYTVAVHNLTLFKKEQEKKAEKAKEDLLRSLRGCEIGRGLYN